MTRWITIGIYYTAEELPDFRILALDAENEEDAKAMAEEIGNVPGTTSAWTPDGIRGLIEECCSGKADYVQAPEGETNIVRDYNPEAGDRIIP